MLFAALVVAAAACAASVDDDRRAPYRGAAVGLLLTLAFFAKQTAAVYGPLLALMLWRRQRRAAVSMVATGALATAVALALLQWSTDGQYWTETIRVMAGHAWLKDLAVSATARLWVFIPYALVVPPLWLIAWRKRWLRSRSALWVGMFLVALPASVAASAKAAAHVNNLMMAVVLAGPVTIMIALDVARGLRRTRWHSVAIALGVALMGWCTFDWPMRFARYIPSPADWRAAASVNAVIASLPGDVVMPEHPFIPVRHGKGIDQPITQAYSDHMTLTGFAPLACFDATQASWAVLGTAPTPLVSGLVARQFELERSVGRAPNMRSGYRTRPRIVLRRRPSHQRQRAHTLFDFEDQSYRGWTREGDAFVTPLATTRAVLGTGGGHFASSWHRERGDAAQGRLTSPPFRIDRDYLGLTVGGGGSGVRVELWVGGKRVHLALGRDSFVMIPYIWDVRAHRGQLAELHVIDVSPHPWGHIHLDDVVMFDDGPQQLR
jgi:hypothetical protein